MKYKLVDPTGEQFFGAPNSTSQQATASQSTFNYTPIIIGGVIVLAFVIFVYYENKKLRIVRNQMSDMKDYLATFPIVTREFEPDAKPAKNSLV